MEVEAHHAHLFRSHLLTNSEIIGSEADQPGTYGLQEGIVAPVADAAVAAAASRKRPRPPSFLGGDGLCYVQQQMWDFDRLVLQHAESVRAELAVRRHGFARWVVAALEEGVLERLKAKEEEIARVGERNWALEERIRRLRVENQVWRDLAQRSEAAANVLRAKLEHALAAAQVRTEEEATAENAEFCRSGTNEEGEAAVGRGWGTACRSCREREPSVLLLPCRHLCLCAACGPVVDACPVCSCTKNGSVQVNMSRVQER
ncbi:probable BOI-related E3 ubiquitin-protein ligase 3 isoform X1 [Musa acuminata AAA Group]|uniref:probable BOI-related E3 ubiquitin-protein ligase 3 isoform X1 n=1 Tax=Musa acuminata AAA Group TaxID=214697 RepID=UPI0031D3EF6F